MAGQVCTEQHSTCPHTHYVTTAGRSHMFEQLQVNSAHRATVQDYEVQTATWPGRMHTHVAQLTRGHSRASAIQHI